MRSSGVSKNGMQLALFASIPALDYNRARGRLRESRLRLALK